MFDNCFVIISRGHHRPGLLYQLLNVLQQDVVTDIVRQLVNHTVGNTEHLRVNQVFEDGDGGTGNKAFFLVIQRRVTDSLVLNAGQKFSNLRLQCIIPADGHRCVCHHFQAFIRIVAVINFCCAAFHHGPDN